MHEFSIEPLIAKRKKMRLSYRELGVMAELSHVVIQQTFIGAVNPSVRVILALCNALEVSPKTLFTRKES